MNSRDFCFWLKGVLDGAKGLDVHKTASIRETLKEVFIHDIDPKTPDPDGTLQAAHDGKLTNEQLAHELTNRPPLVRC